MTSEPAARPPGGPPSPQDNSDSLGRSSALGRSDSLGSSNPLSGARPPSDLEAGAPILDQFFDADSLYALRAAVAAHAAEAGLSPGRSDDLVIAVHELAANAVRHGGGTGQLRIRIAAGKLRCQVTDQGNALANGHLPTVPSGLGSGPAVQPWPYQPGHGLWLVRRAADQLTVTTGPRGSQVTVSFTLPGAP